MECEGFRLGDTHFGAGMLHRIVAVAANHDHAFGRFHGQLPPQVKTVEVYVDDASVQVISEKGNIVNTTVRVTEALVEAFQEGAGLPVSTTKGRVVATTHSVAQRVEAALATQGYKAVRSMTVLGVDTTAGKGGTHGQARIRMKASEKRKGRFEKLRKMGADTAGIVQGALPPAVT